MTAIQTFPAAFHKIKNKHVNAKSKTLLNGNKLYFRLIFRNAFWKYLKFMNGEGFILSNHARRVSLKQREKLIL